MGRESQCNARVAAFTFFLHENTKKGGAFPHHKRHTAALAVAPPCTPALPLRVKSSVTPLLWYLIAADYRAHIHPVYPDAFGGLAYVFANCPS